MCIREVTLGLIQMTCSENVEANFAKTLEKIREAAQKGANIICTQELFKSRYFCQTVNEECLNLAEPIHAEAATIKILRALCKELNIVLVASLFEDRGVGVYHNTSVVIDADGRYLGRYRKMHIPEDPYYLEKFYLTPGDADEDCYPVFDTQYGKVGVLICWDQWYPEAARAIALNGAEIIFYPTAIGNLDSENTSGERQDHSSSWVTVQRGHAVANGCYIAAVNRTGYESSPDGLNGIHFWGQSFIAQPTGELVVIASEDKEETIIQTIDLAETKRARRDWAYFFRDRRIDSYSHIIKRSL